MVTTTNSLTAQHQAFIDDITVLVDSARTTLTKAFVQSFDLESVLTDPLHGKQLMAKIMLMLDDYLGKAGTIGQDFGEVKAKEFEDANSD